MSTDRLAFGRKVRRSRKDKGIGLRELARRIDVDYSNLSRIERGQRPPPDLETVVRIADELDIERTDLLSLAGVPEEVFAEESKEERRSWITGKVADKSDDLTEIDTGDWKLHIAKETSAEEVRLGLRPEDITLFLSKEGFSGSSARNRIKGTIEGLEDYENYNLVTVNCGSFSLEVAITDTSLDKMDLKPGKEVYATFKATAPLVKAR